MGYTQADLDALKAAVAMGEKSVQFSDRAVTYRSLDELLQAIRVIEADLGTASKTVQGYGSKGL